MFNPAELKLSLARLRATSGQPHRFELNPCLTEHEVDEFENRYGVRLPREYRSYLIELGNGGAGPYCGIFRLGMDYDRKMRSDVLMNLPKWFLHQEDWDMPQNFPDPEHRYFSDDIMQGALPICTAGCATTYWLVVSGPAMGQIWFDWRCDSNGIEPVLDEDEEFTTFGIWYSEWVRNCEREFGLL